MKRGYILVLGTGVQPQHAGKCCPLLLQPLGPNKLIGEGLGVLQVADSGSELSMIPTAMHEHRLITRRRHQGNTCFVFTRMTSAV